MKGIETARYLFRLGPSPQEAKVASFQKLSGGSTPGTSQQDGQFEPPYDKWRRDDLYHLAQQQGIENRANMSTDELARALRETQ
tara:strand:+ start:367813 stop:368064 length:252 start_codon:yes stop_codon:yes gene_type:complete